MQESKEYEKNIVRMTCNLDGETNLESESQFVAITQA